MLAKQINYFLGPEVKQEYSISEALKVAAERYTSATYVDYIYEFNDSGQLIRMDEPEPLIPFPHEIAKGHVFTIRKYQKETETYNYYICKDYTIFQYQAGIKPNPDDWVISMDIESKTDDIIQYKDLVRLKWHENYSEEDFLTDNVSGIVIARAERLVK